MIGCEQIQNLLMSELHREDRPLKTRTLILLIQAGMIEKIRTHLERLLEQDPEAFIMVVNEGGCTDKEILEKALAIAIRCIDNALQTPPWRIKPISDALGVVKLSLDSMDKALRDSIGESLVKHYNQMPLGYRLEAIDIIDRTNACCTLDGLGRLTAIVNDNNEAVINRVCAARALLRLQPNIAVPFLRSIAQNPRCSPVERLTAIHALLSSGRGSSGQRQALLKNLHDALDHVGRSPSVEWAEERIVAMCLDCLEEEEKEEIINHIEENLRKPNNANLGFAARLCIATGIRSDAVIERIRQQIREHRVSHGDKTDSRWAQIQKSKYLLYLIAMGAVTDEDVVRVAEEGIIWVLLVPLPLTLNIAEDARMALVEASRKCSKLSTDAMYVRACLGAFSDDDFALTESLLNDPATRFEDRLGLLEVLTELWIRQGCQCR